MLDKEIGEADSKALDALMLQRSSLEEDLAYVLYYPKHLKYIGLFRDRDAKSERLIARAKQLAMEARREDLKNNRPDKVRSCLGRPVSLDNTAFEDENEGLKGEEEEEGEDKVEMGGGSTGKRKREERSIGLKEEEGKEEEEEDLFFADGMKSQSSSSLRNSQSKVRSTSAPSKGRASEGSSQSMRKKFDLGSKQGDRLRKWQQHHKQQTPFIVPHRPNSSSSSSSHDNNKYADSGKQYEKLTYEKKKTPSLKASSSSSSSFSNQRGARPSSSQAATAAPTRAASAWEAGGGVSAGVSSERNRSKQIGLIVQGAGKKKVFSDDD